MQPNVLDLVSEGVVRRDIRAENDALVEKWRPFGLLEGLATTQHESNMALMLENEAKYLLKEASTMAGGDVEGFAAVAFPIVRRVFGETIANNLVSVQPMNLPAGLIFFLDFTYNSTRLGNTAGESLYGGGRVGNQITAGVLIDTVGDTQYGEKSFYANNNGYSSATSSISGLTVTNVAGPFVVGNDESTDAYLDFDPDVASGSYAQVVSVTVSAAQAATIQTRDMVAIVPTLTNTSGAVAARRLTKVATGSNNRTYNFAFLGTASFSSLVAADQAMSINYPERDNLTNADALGAIVGITNWGLENNPDIPEINLKINSISVTTSTKKLKAKWTPELGQDLNAYHAMDAEVELTGILSEQIQLELDREIIEDLIKEATAGTYFWSRLPGKFVKRNTGEDVSNTTSPPDFTGNISEWYESLLETINDLSAQIHRKALRGGATAIVTSPEVASILETTAGWRASTEVDANTGTAGAVKVGNVSRKWDVYVDPYFRRNLILVIRKGSGFLESGYVFAPYIPLQVTPTIFGEEDFVPRKGVMTRYAKKMVRPDFYGLVVVMDMLLPNA